MIRTKASRVNIDDWMQTARAATEQWIAQDFRAMDPHPGSVEEAMHYSLAAGGKRLRPLLVLAAGEYVGIGDWVRLQAAALAVEYLHTYSLIHDDLPAMDDDDLRRGRATSHKVFGEAMAILAGDALLTEAFSKMMTLTEAGFGADGVVRASRRLADNAGRRGLVAGQVKDLAAEQREIDAEALREIHLQKTASLIEAAVTIPALLLGDGAAEQHLVHYGRLFGLAFQMVDDILNVVGDSGQMGKATGTDAGRGKATYPRLLGLDKARAMLREISQLAVQQLDPQRGAVLIGLMVYAVDRTW